MSNREVISKRTRFDVFKRDGFVCQYCGRHPPDVMLEIDHVIPICQSGDNAESNLLTSCCDCNRGKAGNSLKLVPPTLAEKAEEIRAREEQLAAYREVIEVRLDRIEDDLFRVAEKLKPGSKTDGVLRIWVPTIKNFNTLLPLHEVLEAAEIAFAKIPYSDQRRFRYFCGVCWTKIRNLDAGNARRERS
jgi:hypothetical protein